MHSRFFKVSAIEPRTVFPMDMLRYEAAWPYSSEDAVAIQNSYDPTYDNTAMQIHLQTHTGKMPARERWLSMGWQVVEIGGRQVSYSTRMAQQTAACGELKPPTVETWPDDGRTPTQRDEYRGARPSLDQHEQLLQQQIEQAIAPYPDR